MRQIDDRHRQPPGLGEIGRNEPAPRFDELRQVDEERLRTRPRKECADVIAPFAGLSCERFRESRQTRLVRMERSLPSDDVVRHHVQIPQAPDLLAEPFGFAR